MLALPVMTSCSEILDMDISWLGGHLPRPERHTVKCCVAPITFYLVEETCQMFFMHIDDHLQRTPVSGNNTVCRYYPTASNGLYCIAAIRHEHRERGIRLLHPRSSQPGLTAPNRTVSAGITRSIP